MYRIRLQHQHTSEGDLSRLNDQAHLKGENRWREPDVERMEIELTDEPSGAELRRWFSHPDDGVLLSFLQCQTDEARLGRRKWRGDMPTFLKALRLSIERSHENGDCWDPILEELHGINLWRKRESGENPRPEQSLPSLPSPEDLLERSVRWLAEEATPEETSELISSPNFLVKNTAIRHAGGIRNDTLRTTLGGTKDPMPWIENPHLTPLQNEYLSDYLVSRNRSPDRVTRGMTILAERGVRLSDRVFEKLTEQKMGMDTTQAAVIRSGILTEQQTRALFEKNWRPFDEPPEVRAKSTLTALASCPDLASECRARIIEDCASWTSPSQFLKKLELDGHVDGPVTRAAALAALQQLFGRGEALPVRCLMELEPELSDELRDCLDEIIEEVPPPHTLSRFIQKKAETHGRISEWLMSKFLSHSAETVRTKALMSTDRIQITGPEPGAPHRPDPNGAGANLSR